MNAIQTMTQANGVEGGSVLDPARKGASDDGEEGFGNELAAAEGIAASQRQALVAGLPAQGAGSPLPAPAAPLARPADAPAAPAAIAGEPEITRLQAGTEQALQAGLLGSRGQRVATSLNTASAIAGLKPWNKEWVTQGMDPFEAQRGDAEDVAARRAEALMSLVRQVSEGAAQSQEEAPSDPRIEPPPQGQPVSADLDPAVLRAPHAPALVAQPGARRRATGGEGGGAGAEAEPRMREAPASSDALPSAGSASMTGGDYLQTLAALRGTPAEKSVRGPSGETLDGASQKRPLTADPSEAHGLLKAAAKRSGAEVKEFPWGGSLNEWARMGTSEAGVKAPAASMKGLEAQVVSGPMARPRLSTDTVTGVAGELKALGAQGGGTMTVRLRPDHLGELHLRVSATASGQVALQIRASDERAKQVLEDSLSSLRDSMASQNLKLASVDLSVARAASGHEPGFSGGGSNPQSSSHLQQQTQPGMDQGGYGAAWAQQQGNGAYNPNQGLWDRADDLGESAGRSRGMTPAAGLSMAASSRPARAGRLDVRG